MNQDILTFLMSLVALESIFSFDKLILDNKYLSISYENLKMVMSLKDWCDVEYRQ